MTAGALYDGRIVCDVIPPYADNADTWKYRIGNLDFIIGAKNDDVEGDIDTLLEYIEYLREDIEGLKDTLLG